MNRHGKIARLSWELRKQLNVRLAAHETGPALLAWLNGLPEVIDLLAAEFAGAPVSKQNLSEWRQGGFVEWQLREELLGQAESLAERASGIDEFLVDDLARVLVVKLGEVLLALTGEVDDALERRFKLLQGLSREVARLQRNAPRAALERNRLERLRAEDEAQAEQAAEQELTKPLQSLMRHTHLAKVFGGGKEGDKLADLVGLLRGDEPVAGGLGWLPGGAPYRGPEDEAASASPTGEDKTPGKGVEPGPGSKPVKAGQTKIKSDLGEPPAGAKPKTDSHH